MLSYNSPHQLPILGFWEFLCLVHQNRAGNQFLVKDKCGVAIQNVPYGIKIPLNGVGFSYFIDTFAMSYRHLGIVLWNYEK